MQTLADLTQRPQNIDGLRSAGEARKDVNLERTMKHRQDDRSIQTEIERKRKSHRSTDRDNETTESKEKQVTHRDTGIESDLVLVVLFVFCCSLSLLIPSYPS